MFEYREEHYDDDGCIEMSLFFRLTDACLESIVAQEKGQRNSSLCKKVKGYEVILENDNVGIYWSPKKYDIIKVVTDRVRTYDAAMLARMYGISHFFFFFFLEGNHPDVQLEMTGGTVEGTFYKKMFNNKIMVNSYNGKGHFEYLNGQMQSVEEFMKTFQGDIKHSDLCFVACFPQK